MFDKEKKQQAQKLTNGNYIFGKENYRLVLIGLALLIIGFLLMIGGSSESPDVFNYEIFNFRRLTLAPILVIAGFAVEVYAIMKRPKKQ